MLQVSVGDLSEITISDKGESTAEWKFPATNKSMGSLKNAPELDTSTSSAVAMGSVDAFQIAKENSAMEMPNVAALTNGQAFGEHVASVGSMWPPDIAALQMGAGGNMVTFHDPNLSLYSPFTVTCSYS